VKGRVPVDWDEIKAGHQRLY